MDNIDKDLLTIIEKYDVIIDKIKKENRLIKDISDIRNRTLDVRSNSNNEDMSDGDFKMQIIYDDKNFSNKILFNSLEKFEEFEKLGEILYY